MKNVKLDVKNDILTVTIDLSKRLGLSKSGKTVVIASTEGNIPIPGHEEIKLGINVYTKE